MNLRLLQRLIDSFRENALMQYRKLHALSRSFDAPFLPFDKLRVGCACSR